MTTVHPIKPTHIRLGLPPKGWRFLIILLLIFGILFRFVNIDHKIYWTDEVYTSLRISGYTEKEFIQKLGNGQAITQKELHLYQKLNSDKTLVDTVKGLAVEEPQMTPLYFIFIRFWAQLFGDSIATVRFFSALINLLSIPLIYWLCVELFQSSLVGWVALGLFSVSPLQIVYAQEARPYSLLVAAVLLSHITLLRSLRLKTNKSYGFYALTVVLGLYSHLLFAFVALGHGIYVLLIEKSRWTPTVKNYIFASAIAVLGFAPWIVVLLRYSKSATDKLSWQSFKLSPLDSLSKWILNISRIFFDMGSYQNYSQGYLILFFTSILITMILSVYALYFLIKNSSVKVSSFLLICIFLFPTITTFFRLFKDSFISMVTRYSLPSAIGLELAVAYLITTQITEMPRKKLWQGIFILMTSMGVISGVIMTQNLTWWNKAILSPTLEIAPLIKSSKSTLVITDISEYQISNDLTYQIGSLICLSYQLEPQIKYMVVVPPNLPHFSENEFSNVFLYNPSHTSKKYWENSPNWKLKLVYQSTQEPIMFLWKLERRSR